MNELSILETHAQRAHLLEAADMLWANLAEQLATRVPLSMQKFARTFGLIKHDDHPDVWMLPSLLEDLVTHPQWGVGGFEVQTRRLPDYGFASLDDLQAGVHELAQVWDSLIRIEVITQKASVTIRFYLSEVAKPQEEEATQSA